MHVSAILQNPGRREFKHWHLFGKNALTSRGESKTQRTETERIENHARHPAVANLPPVLPSLSGRTTGGIIMETMP